MKSHIFTLPIIKLIVRRVRCTRYGTEVDRSGPEVDRSRAGPEVGRSEPVLVHFWFTSGPLRSPSVAGACAHILISYRQSLAVAREDNSMSHTPARQSGNACPIASMMCTDDSLSKPTAPDPPGPTLPPSQGSREMVSGRTSKEDGSLRRP